MTRLHRHRRASPQPTARDGIPHPTLKQQIRAALHVIMQRPAAGKALKNEVAGLRSYRVGRSRIVYRLAGERTIEIVAIGPRRTIYEETYRLLRRP